jgi:prepilin-type processing-associated H-X9-DG protein
LAAAQWPNVSNSAYSGPQGMDVAGGYWMSGYPVYSRYNHVLPPNSPTCGFGADAGYGAYTATSRHPGGVNVGFGDGSVKFIKSTVNNVTWWALATRAGGEVVSADSY